MFNEILSNEIMLRRKQLIVITKKHAYLNEKHQEPVYVFNKELENIGYRLSYRLISRLLHESPNYINKLKDVTLKYLKGIIGQADNMEPLFPDYPNFIDKVLDESTVNMELFQYIYADWKNDTEEVDINKVCEIMGVSLEDMPNVEEYNINPSLKVLDIGTREDYINLYRDLLSYKVSYSLQDKEDLREMLNEWNFIELDLKLYDVFPKELPIKENLVYITLLLYNQYGENIINEFMYKYYKTYTDVLRLACALSFGDVSLAEPCKYKNFTRAERKMLLNLFEQCSIGYEDVLRHKQAFLRLGEKIHPGEYKSRFPKTYKTFNMLRNDIKKLKRQTFNHKIEEAFNNKDLDFILELLEKRPGEFARKLNRVLILTEEQNKDTSEVINRFMNVADKVPTSLLVNLLQYFEHRTEDTDRVFFPKGEIAKAYSIKNELKPLKTDTIINALEDIETKICTILSNKEPLGKVYIDDSLRNYVAPLKIRDMSKTNKPIERGSRFKIEKDRIRFFLHWLNTVDQIDNKVDLDLSITLLDEDFEWLDHVSFSKLKTDGCIHSGDVTDAPPEKGGGTEYIDINMNKLHPKVRYIMASVHSYTFQKFYELPEAFVGYMDLDEYYNGEAYNPKFVKMKADMTTNQQISTPCIIDVDAKEIIWCDLGFVNIEEYNTVEAFRNKGIITLKNILNSHKPSLYSLVKLNAIARGIMVDDIKEADIVFTDKKDELKDTDKIIRVREIEIERLEKGEDGNIVKYIDKDIETYEAKIITPFDIDIICTDLI